jgi:hypothetical protein
MKSQLIALAAAALLASVSGASLAQDANPPASTTPAAASGGGGVAAVRAACDAEVMKMCPDIMGADAYRQCVTTNYASLSDGCKSAIQAYQASSQSSAGG